MRILQVLRYGSVRGGAETYVATVSQGLRAAGHHVALAAALDVPDGAFAVPALARDGEAEPPHDGAEALASAIDAFAPDVVHVHTPQVPWVAPFSAARAPTLLAVHDHRVHCPAGTKYWTARKQVCDVDPGRGCLFYNVTAHCGSLRANLTLRPYRTWKAAHTAAIGLPRLQAFSGWIRDALASTGIDAARIAVTPYPTPPRVAPAHLELEDMRAVVLAPGRLNREKGFEQLIESTASIGTPVHLVIAGDGHARDRLERRARVATGGHRITFTGWLSAAELAAWYARAALVVMPSMWPEPFGITGLEAMSHGKAVVAFDVGGVREWLADGETGVLVPHGDVRALGRAIGELVRDRERRSRLGEAGSARAMLDLSLDAHVERLVALYEDARRGQA